MTQAMDKKGIIRYSDIGEAPGTKPGRSSKSPIETDWLIEAGKPSR
jgi:hypothetical protein